MNPRPDHITKINAVELLPVAAETLEFHLVLTGADGFKQTFVMDTDAVTGLLDGHLNVLNAITLHALSTKGPMT